MDLEGLKVEVTYGEIFSFVLWCNGDSSNVIQKTHSPYPHYGKTSLENNECNQFGGLMRPLQCGGEGATLL